MGNTHTDVQEMLADVRAWTPVVVSAGGTEYPITGVSIEHDEEGAQTKAVIQTASDAPADPAPADPAPTLP